ncbi:pectinesterase inhibitor 2-like [Hordeum vulgare subsp. vulgare]|uniref:Predicted protein n=1 Tax=Hordeum vulgare subsp. vulgare TaxID=112509 RepID=F2EHE7_HORVV|nr:pectinesterase inhibitor 2-like [Hordeum vulgare subsp. vulgare]BAK06769.1 predicted protein [Hordeum vulgare subsp. vulgare]
MATRRSNTSGSHVPSFLFLALLFLASLLVAGAKGPVVDVKASCAKTDAPIFCTATLSAEPDSKTADARGLAEIAIKACARLGSTVGSYARRELDLVKDNPTWQCLDECAEDIEDALSHIDDAEGGIDDAKFDQVRQYLDLSEEDTWSCDESCRETPPSPVRTELLRKNQEFEKMMNVTRKLIKLVDVGAKPAPKPAILP